MTDSRPEADSTPSKPRGLWSLMGTPAEPSSAPVDEKTDASASHEQPKAATSADAESSPAKQRGLWGMMGKAPVADHPGSASTPVDDADQEAESTSPPAAEQPGGRRGLFAMMQQADEETTDSEDMPDLESMLLNDEAVAAIREQLQQESRRSLPPLPDEPDEVELDESPEADEPSEPRELIDLRELEPPRYRAALLQAIRHSWTSLGCGLGAILLSLLTLLPHSLAGIPASVLGFAGIICGYLAVTGPGRRDLSSRLRATSLAGMLLGTIGIFLGPLLFAGLGRSLREPTGPETTRQNLTRIGQGLDEYYKKNDAYPIGGTFARDDAGEIRGQHGWMTFLLPFVGEAELYQQIDQTKPYDHPVNRNAMGRNVSVYFAAGGDRSRIGDGYAVAHFAGVGGEIDDANGLAHLGIFERDAAVKRDEITDGLSNTLIVGELGKAYPPWGDPENWHKIGNGLNKDPSGFGSVSGQGAMFLLADGSVKIFSNKTDLGLLKKMSTRDGKDDR